MQRLTVVDLKECCVLPSSVPFKACGDVANVVKLIGHSVWTLELSSSLPSESCRRRVLVGQVASNAAGQLLLSWACHFLLSVDTWWQVEVWKWAGRRGKVQTSEDSWNTHVTTFQRKWRLYLLQAEIISVYWPPRMMFYLLSTTHSYWQSHRDVAQLEVFFYLSHIWLTLRD